MNPLTAAMEYGLTQEIIGAIQRVFAKFPDIERAILYGSRAMGKFRYNSDIDITLNGSIAISTLFKIETALDNLLLPYKIDLSAFDKIDNPALREHIIRRGKVLYERIRRKA